MSTVWKPVTGFPGYEVSEDGMVRSRYGRILSSPLDGSGYRYVSLKIGRGTHRKRVHVLVAAAFWVREEGLDTVDHIDGDKSNNHYSNLQWVTRAINTQRAAATGLINNSGSRNGQAKLTEADIIPIRTSAATIKELARRYGVREATISNIRNGKRWKHVKHRGVA